MPDAYPKPNPSKYVILCTAYRWKFQWYGRDSKVAYIQTTSLYYTRRDHVCILRLSQIWHEASRVHLNYTSKHREARVVSVGWHGCIT